jgi:hypothetical protein
VDEGKVEREGHGLGFLISLLGFSPPAFVLSDYGVASASHAPADKRSACHAAARFCLWQNQRRRMERVRGIEPLSKAWEAFVLPLNYTRLRALGFGGQTRLCVSNFGGRCDSINGAKGNRVAQPKSEASSATARLAPAPPSRGSQNPLGFWWGAASETSC